MWSFLQTLDPVTSILSIYPKEWKSSSETQITASHVYCSTAHSSEGVKTGFTSSADECTEKASESVRTLLQCSEVSPCFTSRENLSQVTESIDEPKNTTPHDSQSPKDRHLHDSISMKHPKMPDSEEWRGEWELKLAAYGCKISGIQDGNPLETCCVLLCVVSYTVLRIKNFVESRFHMVYIWGMILKIRLLSWE